MRVIEGVNIEYQPVFRFMRSAAMNRERFSQLNSDSKRIDAIKQELRDTTPDWIKIPVPKGRKNAPPFYCLVPRQIAELLPVLDQNGNPIVAESNINNAWKAGRKRAGFIGPEYNRFGCHNLRSVWLSEAQRRKLDPVLMQHLLGHIVDSMNHMRIQQDVNWAITEFRNAWQTQTLATEDDLTKRDLEIETLRAELKNHQAMLLELNKAITAAKTYATLSEPYTTRLIELDKKGKIIRTEKGMVDRKKVLKELEHAQDRLLKKTRKRPKQFSPVFSDF